jgi:hypothetical protein
MSIAECTLHYSLQVPAVAEFMTGTIPACSVQVLFRNLILFLWWCRTAFPKPVKFEMEKIKFISLFSMLYRKERRAMIIAKKEAKHMHSIVSNQREWLFVLICVNASRQAIPGFYIFRGKRIWQNYIKHCEAGATMAMQPRSWMTSCLFSAWISYFLECVRRLGGIFLELCHLLILDGHNSHMTLEVVMEARRVGLDLLTLPSHTSDALQPLDVSVFKPYKQHFREYKDF